MLVLLLLLFWVSCFLQSWNELAQFLQRLMLDFLLPQDIACYLNLIRCQTNQRFNLLINNMILHFSDLILQFLEVHFQLKIELALHQLPTNVLLDISLVLFILQWSLFGKPMPLKKSNRPIICKRKNMLNLLRLAMVLELIHDFWSETRALVFFVHCQKCNLVKGSVLEASKSNTCNYFLTHFYDQAFMYCVEKKLNDILARHFGQLPGVKIFEIGQIFENVDFMSFDVVLDEKKLQWVHVRYLWVISVNC